jgi:hypothetical protein
MSGQGRGEEDGRRRWKGELVEKTKETSEADRSLGEENIRWDGAVWESSGDGGDHGNQGHPQSDQFDT